MSDNKEISFLLGAGFSADAGIPIRIEINNRLKKLDWKEFMIYSETTTKFINEPDPNSHWQNVRERQFVQSIIEFYNVEITSEFDYEEFYDYCYKIYSGEIDLRFETFLENYILKKGRFLDKKNLISITIRSIDYLVDDLLTNDINIYNTKGINIYYSFLNLIRDLSKKFETISIFTLNHDLLLEQLLISESNYLDYSDGFEISGTKYYIKTKNQQIRIKYYSNKFDKKIRVIKLHGSIDNYIYNFSEPYEMVKISKNLYPPDLHRETMINGNWIEENCWTLYQPHFLSGTTTKIINYNKHPYYVNQFKHFRESLKNCKLLISIGYGLQDSKINEFLELELMNSLRILVIKRTKNPSSFFENHNVFHYGQNKGIAELNLENIEKYILQ